MLRTCITKSGGDYAYILGKKTIQLLAYFTCLRVCFILERDCTVQTRSINSKQKNRKKWILRERKEGIISTKQGPYARQ